MVCWQHFDIPQQKGYLLCGMIEKVLEEKRLRCMTSQQQPFNFSSFVTSFSTEVCKDRMRGGFSYNIMRHHCGFLVETIKRDAFFPKKTQGFCYMSCPFMSHVLFLIRVVLNISFWDLKCFFLFFPTIFW